MTAKLSRTPGVRQFAPKILVLKLAQAVAPGRNWTICSLFGSVMGFILFLLSFFFVCVFWTKIHLVRFVIESFILFFLLEFMRSNNGLG
jgi:hypothetical protein